MKRVPLPKSFFERPTVEVARDLVGCYLVRRRTSKASTEIYMISETEAYDGTGDLGSHASKGRTKRTEIMFGPAGRAYIYFVYGIHWMLNIVTGDAEYPAAVLIRGALSDKGSLKGPAVLTKKLGITGELNGLALGRKAGLWIEPRDKDFDPKKIRAGTRIGIGYAGPLWAKRKWRFYLG